MTGDGPALTLSVCLSLTLLRVSGKLRLRLRVFPNTSGTGKSVSFRPGQNRRPTDLPKSEVEDFRLRRPSLTLPVLRGLLRLYPHKR